MGIQPDELISEWKNKVRYNAELKERFIDKWTEMIEGYIYSSLFDDYAPHTKIQTLAVIVSFFKKHRIPVNPEHAKHAYVKYHNRDLKREEIKRILEYANPRDRTFFLMMAESGLRPNTVVQLRYKHIKKDFEVARTPMMIDLPSELLKDRVEHRWTFIGEDGFKVLKAYLQPRMPLKSEDLIFIPERAMKHEFLKPHTFTNRFSKIVLQLGIAEETKKGKPKRIRLYCLRKYFNNNIRADRSFIEFWMAHKTTQTAYVSRDPERHREEYAKAYENLRIYTKEPAQNQRIKQLERQLEETRRQLEDRDKMLNALDPLLEFAQRNPEALKKFLNELAPKDKTDVQVAIGRRTVKWMDKALKDRNVLDERKIEIRKHRRGLRTKYGADSISEVRS